MSRYRPPAPQIITDITRKAFLAAGARFADPRLAATIEVSETNTRQGDPAVKLAFALQCVATRKMIAASDSYQYFTNAIASCGTAAVRIAEGNPAAGNAHIEANVTVALDREDLTTTDPRSIAIDAITRAVYLSPQLVSPSNVRLNNHMVDLARRETLRERKSVYTELDSVATTMDNHDGAQALRSIKDWTIAQLRRAARTLDAERRSGIGLYDETRRENLRTVIEAEANRRGQTLSPQRNERAIEALAERAWYIDQCAWATPDAYIANPANLEAGPLDTLRTFTTNPETLKQLSAYTGLHMTRERIEVLQATLYHEHSHALGLVHNTLDNDYAHPSHLLGPPPRLRPGMARDQEQALYDGTRHVTTALEGTSTRLTEGARRLARAGFHAAAECAGQIRGGTDRAIETSLEGTRTIETYTAALAGIGRESTGKGRRER